MRPVLYIGIGVALGFALASRLRPPSQARCCEQLEKLVRGDVRKRCGAAAGVCEGLGDAFGIFGHSSALLDLAGVT
jgi:hypothetical protein